MKYQSSEDHMRLAARLYYQDGFGQGAVAQFMRISQAKVSRLLARARDRGIVRITVADYEPRHPVLEDAIRRRFGISMVVVIKSLDRQPGENLRRSVGHFAAAELDTLITPQDTVAVAGGRTIREIAKSLPPARYQALTVVPAMGSVDNSAICAFDAQAIARLVTQRLGGSLVDFDAPVFVDRKQSKDDMLRRPQIRMAQEYVDRARLALVGIGTLDNSIFVERGTLTPAIVSRLRQAGAVGEICGRFFDKDGEECDTPWREFATSVGTDELRAIPQVIAIVSGRDRASAVAAAIHGKLIRGLVIDEAGAQALLANDARSL